MSSNNMRYWLLAALALLACVWAAPVNAACAGGTCFVVPGGGNSNSTATWSTDATSSHTTCTCVPTTTDNVILDSSSGQLTINAALSIGTLDASGTGGTGVPYDKTLTHSNTFALTINTAAANSLKFSTQMTYSPATGNTTKVIFANTSGTAVLTSSGKVFTAVEMNGVNGTVQLADNIDITHGTANSNPTLTITNGTFDANGKTITTGTVVSSGAATRVLILGGLVRIGGTSTSNGQSIWNVVSTLTFTKNSANISVMPLATGVQSAIFAGAAFTYNSLITEASTTPATLGITGNNGFSALTINSGWWINFAASATQTLSGLLTVTGTPTSFAGMTTATTNGTSTISAAAGACASSYAVLYAITGTGGCTFTATNSLNMGGTVGWTITGPTIGTGFVGIIGGQ